MMNKAYISGALMGARDLERVKILYNFVADVCLRNGYIPYLPHLNTDPIHNREVSDIEVFSKDYTEMISSSVVLSYIGEPSLGVGAELSICVNHNIPVVSFSQRQSRVSRFLKGMLALSGNAKQIEFDDFAGLENELSAILHDLR
jgi:2'-deoxynucleoside 5'-phosphate N-hydrolase